MRSSIIKTGGALQTTCQQKGMSLLEVLIGLTIASSAMILMAQMSAQSASEMRAKNTAESLQSFQRAATNYFLANRTEMMDAMINTGSNTNGDKHCKIDVAANGTGGTRLTTPSTTLTCTLDSTLLTARAGLPAGIAVNNDSRIRWIATFRRIKDGGGSPTDNVDLLIYGAATAAGSGNNLIPMEARIGASIAGGNGGAIFPANQPGCLATEACGSGGGWKVLLSDFGVSKTAVAPKPRAMAGTLSSYTFFPAELSSTAVAQLPAAAVGDGCTTEGGGAIAADGVLLTCLDAAYRAPGYLPTAVQLTACSPNGRIGKDATGLLLSCQSGLWKKQV